MLFRSTAPGIEVMHHKTAAHRLQDKQRESRIDIRRDGSARLAVQRHAGDMSPTLKFNGGAKYER